MYKHPFLLCLTVTWFLFYDISTVANFSYIFLEIVYVLSNILYMCIYIYIFFIICQPAYTMLQHISFI